MKFPTLAQLENLSDPVAPASCRLSRGHLAPQWATHAAAGTAALRNRRLIRCRMASISESAMDKRTFLKLSSAMLATPFISSLSAWAKEGKMAGDKLKNWAGNLEYSTENLYSANSMQQAQDFVRKQSHLKVLGTRHCFNNIADSKFNLLSLRSMDKVIALDPAARTVTVEAGISYGQLAPYLDSKGFALHNLASLPHISVAGACSTGTHGSGDKERQPVDRGVGAGIRDGVRRCGHACPDRKMARLFAEPWLDWALSGPSPKLPSICSRLSPCASTFMKICHWSR